MFRPLPRRRSSTCHAYWRRIRSLLLIILIIVVLRVFAWNAIPVSVPATQRDANLAFFVQVSNASNLHLPRLLKAIWHEGNVYLVHFDLKVRHQQRERTIQLLSQDHMGHRSNVVFMESEAVSYAGITMLLNTINGISQLLRASPEWDFFINLSGNDYPLVSPATLRRVLSPAAVITTQLNFLQTQIADKDFDWFFDHRMRHIHIDTALWAGRGDSWITTGSGNTHLDHGELITINASHPTTRDRAPFVKTEGWVILHRTFCEYAVDSALARRLLLSFATARAADELFFGTLLTQAERFRNTVAWDGLRYILWGMHGRKWGRPAYLDQVSQQEEARNLLTNSGALFARKFAKPESPLLDHIDANMSGITERDWEVNETSVQEHTERVWKRLFCIAKRRALGVPCWQ